VPLESLGRPGPRFRFAVLRCSVEVSIRGRDQSSGNCAAFGKVEQQGERSARRRFEDRPVVVRSAPLGYPVKVPVIAQRQSQWFTAVRTVEAVQR